MSTKIKKDFVAFLKIFIFVMLLPALINIANIVLKADFNLGTYFGTFLRYFSGI